MALSGESAALPGTADPNFQSGVNDSTVATVERSHRRLPGAPGPGARRDRDSPPGPGRRDGSFSKFLKVTSVTKYARAEELVVDVLKERDRTGQDRTGQDKTRVSTC